MLFQIVNEYQFLAEKNIFPLLVCPDDKSRLFCRGDIGRIELFCLECDTKITLGKAKYDLIEEAVKNYYVNIDKSS